MKKTGTIALLPLIALIAGCADTSAQTSPKITTPSETTSVSVTDKIEEEPTFEFGEMREMTTSQVVKEMGIGINLGNTMESCGSWINEAGGVKAYETAWGSNVITKEIIQGYADEGFGVLRVPVAWSNMMDDDYTISPDYLARVDEIVGWAYGTGMYVIVNEHYDSGWLKELPENTDECMSKYTRIWEQVGDYFNKYGDKLIFESQNEELGWDSVWNRYSGTSGEEKERSYELLKTVNQRFVDTIRGQGGNNEKRHLLIAGYQTDIDCTCDELFGMPDDPAGRCAVSVHYYTPPTFCLTEKDESWGKMRLIWGSKGDIVELDRNMKKLKERFLDNGIPVIIGEYGAIQLKSRTDFQRRRFNLIVAETAYSLGMCPVLWDTMGVAYDRYDCKLKDQELKKGYDRIREGESLRDELLGMTDPDSENAS